MIEFILLQFFLSFHSIFFYRRDIVCQDFFLFDSSGGDGMFALQLPNQIDLAGRFVRNLLLATRESTRSQWMQSKYKHIRSDAAAFIKGFPMGLKRKYWIFLFTRCCRRRRRRCCHCKSKPAKLAHTRSHSSAECSFLAVNAIHSSLFMHRLFCLHFATVRRVFSHDMNVCMYAFHLM